MAAQEIAPGIYGCTRNKAKYLLGNCNRLADDILRGHKE